MTQDLAQVETWQSATDGRTWLHVKDPRQPTGWRRTKVGGAGTKKIQITVEERLFNQDLVPEERKHLDPFTNGLLVRISPAPEAGDVDGLEGTQYTDEQLEELLQIGSDEVFMETVKALPSEVLVRRLLMVAASKATKLRFDLLQEYVDEKYHVGKTSRVVKELYEDDERYAHADL